MTYLKGPWKERIPRKVLALWERRWPGKDSPQHLFPGDSANEFYLGVEMIPITGIAGMKAAGPGERFTQASYDSLNELLAVLEQRWCWPTGWRKTARLVGHEDVGILDRYDGGGGWDPGALREKPYFRFDRIGGVAFP